jgi:hypothetical protein
MKTPSDELWELIQSLTPSEKRYFKLYAQHSGGKNRNYMALYDAVEAQQGTYDEERLRADNASEDFLNQLSFTKNYLYHLILRSLEAFHSERVVELRVTSMTNQAQLLFNKGLFSQSGKLIRKAEKLARQYEKSLDLATLISRRNGLLRHTADLRYEMIEEFHRGYREELAVLQQYTRLKEMQWLAVQFFALLRDDGILQHAGTKQAQAAGIIARADELAAQEPDYFMLQASYLDIRSMHAMHVLNDTHLSLGFDRRLIDLLEANPHQLQQKPFNLVYALDNYLQHALTVGHWESYEELLATFTELPTRKTLAAHFDKLNDYVVARRGKLELGYYICSRQYAKGLQAAQALAAVFRTHEEQMLGKHRLLYCVNFALLHAFHRDYATAIKWLTPVLNCPDAELRPDLQGFARLFSLFLYWLRGDSELAEYRLGSTKRYLEKQALEGPIERCVLAYLRTHIPRLSGPADAAALFTGLIRTVHEAGLEAEARSLLGYFDLLHWAESYTHG